MNKKLLKRVFLAVFIITLVLFPFIGDFSPRHIHGFYSYDINEKIIAAHKGGSEIYHENSLEAFEYIDKTNVTAIEMDIRKAKDGFVVYHDDEINGLKLKELTIEKLKGIAENSEYTLPTLEESLDILTNGNKKIIIDIKDSGYENEILSIAKKYLSKDQIIISSANPDSIKKIKQMDDEIMTVFVMSMATSKIRTILGIVPWKNIKFSGTDYVSVNGKYLNPSFFKNAENGDIGILVYGITGEDKIRSILEYDSVYGVIVGNSLDAIQAKESLDNHNKQL